MSEYLIQKQTLDNIAEQSNELIGKSVAVSPAEIISDLTEANGEVDSQNALIAQIANTLEGKTGGIAIEVVQTTGNSETKVMSQKAVTEAIPTAVEAALNEAKESGEFDGADGERGFSILRVTTAPSSYTTATGGFTPTYRIALSTVLSESGADAVRVGDTVLRNYYTYHVGYVDASYAYLGKYASIRGSTGAAGAAGASVTVASVSESTEDGGSNVVTFSDGTILRIRNGSKGSTGVGKNGADGYTPVRGTDYWTEADKAEIKAYVDEAILGGAW